MIDFIRHRGKRALLRLGYFKYPDFLIIGAQKAGTTFLFSVLRQHPQIVEPVNKEAHFFDYDINYDRGLFQYHLNFDLSFRFKSNQITFEATPDYLAHKLAPERIHKLLPNIKLIVILREPISRAYSAWKMHHHLFKALKTHRWLHDERTFEQVIEDSLSQDADQWHCMNHIGRGLYGDQLTNVFKYFHRNQVLILFQNDLKRRTQETYDVVTDFLGLNPFDLNFINKHDERFWDNKSQDYEVKIHKDYLINLQKYYNSDKVKIETILGRKVDW